MLHAADVKVPGAAIAATMTMMETISDRHTTLRWVVAALFNESFTDSSSGNHVPVGDEYPQTVNNGWRNCENIDWLSNR
jgi:hypothetical protein